MKGYFIRSSKVTPSVYFNPQKQLLDLRGKSSPENPLTFYNHVLQNLDAYSSFTAPKLVVNMAFEYFNTSSSKCIFLILDKLKKIHQSGKQIVVNWYHEEDDDDMREAGEDYSSFFEYSFNFIEVPEITTLGGPADQKAA